MQGVHRCGPCGGRGKLLNRWSRVRIPAPAPPLSVFRLGQLTVDHGWLRLANRYSPSRDGRDAQASGPVQCEGRPEVEAAAKKEAKRREKPQTDALVEIRARDRGPLRLAIWT